MLPPRPLLEKREQAGNVSTSSSDSKITPSLPRTSFRLKPEAAGGLVGRLVSQMLHAYERRTHELPNLTRPLRLNPEPTSANPTRRHLPAYVSSSAATA